MNICVTFSIGLYYFRQQADMSCAQEGNFRSYVLLGPCDTQVAPVTYPVEAVRG